MTMAALLLCIVLSLFTSTNGQYSRLNDEQKAFIKEREDIVVDLAQYATKLHARRVQHVNQCECSKHGCSNDYLDLPCEHHFGTPSFCETEGWRIDVGETIFRTAPGLDPRNLSDTLKENICVYKHMIDWVKRYNESDFGWIYIATLDGHFRRYPSSARRRGEKGGDALLNDCLTFDPRLRPWFIAASTGPKDIVLVVDCSGSMDQVVRSGSNTTKWDVTVMAVERILGTFSIADFVNVVLFADEARPLYETGLRRADFKHLDFLKKKLSEAKTGGRTNFTAAFTTAFDQLSNHCEEEPRTCSNCQKIVLFLTDGKDNTAANNESVKPTVLAKTISDLQDHLVNKTKKRATVFTYSISDQADDTIPRQVACTNGGAWAFIGPDTDPLDALNSYYLYLAGGRKNVQPVWVEPFTDAAGLGTITTVAMPFFAVGTSDVPDVFLGVAGHDVILHELEVSGASDEEVLGAIIDRSERCTPSQSDICELQAYRNARDEKGVCVDPFPIEERKNLGKSKGTDIVCYTTPGKYYKRFSDEINWDDAKDACEDDGGALASIKHPEELAFIANLASPDGSWIGARRGKEQYQWLDEDVSEISDESSFWALGEPDYTKGIEDCVAIDTRGIIGNLHTQSCKKSRSYICQYASKDDCRAGIDKPPEQGYFEVPPLAYCGYIVEVLDETKPIKQVADLKVDDVMCPFGEVNRTSEEVICCEEKKESKNG